MITLPRFVAAGLAAAAVFAATPALATQIPDGTVSPTNIFLPTVTLGGTNSFGVTNGLTFELAADGGFAGAAGLTGHINGSIQFSGVVGDTVNQNIADFFVFQDGASGTFNFSVSSVKTVQYTNTVGSKSFTLYLLGSTVDSVLGYEATPTSLTLQFNSTNNSAFTGSETLAVPPATPDVPEPATWAMSLLGFGAMGTMLRRRPRTSISFA